MCICVLGWVYHCTITRKPLEIRVFLSSPRHLFSQPVRGEIRLARPPVYSRKKGRRKLVFQRRFAGKQKSPPQPVSLFVPTNVGIHGRSSGNRTRTPFRAAVLETAAYACSAMLPCEALTCLYMQGAYFPRKLTWLTGVFHTA